jgi:hypothetical protein
VFNDVSLHSCKFSILFSLSFCEKSDKSWHNDNKTRVATCSRGACNVQNAKRYSKFITEI